MSVVTVNTAAIVNAWINGSPDKEAWLIRKVPIRPSTLVQLCNGRYRPSEDFWERIQAAMKQDSTASQPSKGDPPEAA